jgi:tyrosyl-tRNA synthetase
MKIFQLLVRLGLAASNGEARRSVTQGAVRINEVKISDPNGSVPVADGDIVQVGKRKFAKVKLV